MRKALDRVEPERTALRLASRVAGAGAPLAVGIGARLGDMVDATSTRLLSGDDAAAQLAFAVETIAERVGREEVMALVLRHNLLLDGTFLAMISPVLSGGAEIAADPDRLRQARGTLVTLLESLVAAASGRELPTAPPTDDAGIAERVDALGHDAPELPLDAVRPYLRGERPPEETAQFVLGSYSLFLQTFLLRSTVKMVPALMRPATPEITD